MSIHLFKNPSKAGLSSHQIVKIPASKLTHEYTSSPAIEKAMPILRSMFEDNRSLFRNKYGADFDRYNLEHGKNMKPLMWADERMKEALTILNLPYSEVRKIYLPWWIESAGNDFGFEQNGERARLILGPRHSYETQMARQGLSLPHIQAVSVAGFPVTSDGQVVLALRGGANFPNTYYFVAGALGILPEVQSGQMSVFDFFVQEELNKEYGLLSTDVQEATLLCRTVCSGGDRDTSYVFVVKTGLSLSNVMERYSANKDEDQKEHSGLVGVPYDEIGPFVRRFFRGAAKNDPARADANRVLLPQGAAPLVSYILEDVGLLDNLAAVHAQPA